ncbi:sugar transferase [Aurantiacibacter sp. D1-12]|uniref:sugar transferase n=1 Tax=Aurantiacibacter sp. D1-12 TaxID=2993658 RepID=UPI00237C8AB9|nr:sugar transferase [Aurantiacibacter sp. D1-12]MDE1468268.1 sugar transferase [Aurantiacibacter sp. D1-12]
MDRKIYALAKRSLDILVSLAVGIIAIPVVLVISLAIKATSKGPVLYWSDRVAAGSGTFRMPKFRTMRVGTPAVATHLLDDADSMLTPIGGFLRRSSLDEIPQLWCILIGEMSLVGPRPALFNQDDLMALRHEAGVADLVPGLTGWAQINGRDELPLPVKVKLEREYMENRSFWFDAKIIAMTAWKVISSKDVQH